MTTDLQKQELDRSYQLLGRYVVAFQRVVFMLEFMISWTFPSRSELINIFFADRTAMDILQLARGIFNQVYKPIGEERRITEGVFKEIIKAIEYRNYLLHGHLFVGYSKKDDIVSTSFSAYKIEKNKNGFEFNNSDKLDEELKIKIQEAETLYGKLFNISGFFSIRAAGHPFPDSLADYLKKHKHIT